MNTPQPEVLVSTIKRSWVKPALALVLVLVLGTVTWLGAQSLQDGRIGPSSSDPAYIVVSTSTPVTFTSVISDSNLRKHDPLKVLLVRTDASGTPIDILGRMRDNGRKADATKRDRTYTIRVTLNEGTVGPIYFKVAAKFKAPLSRSGKDDDDWEKDLPDLDDSKNKGRRYERLAPLLRKLQRYELSEVIVVTVDPFLLPADPGEAGKQTLEGIDSDNDGVRDDVQRFIGVEYSSNPTTARALTQYAAAAQNYLELLFVSGPSLSHAVDIISATTCLVQAAGPILGPSIVPTINRAILNTDERFDAYLTSWRLVHDLPPPIPTEDRVARCSLFSVSN